MSRHLAIITGASSGLGAALAREYARKSWDLLLIARREAELNEVKEQCYDLGDNITVQTLIADVSEPSFPTRLSELIELTSNVDMVYVNAGVGAAGSFEELKRETFERALDINLLGALQTVQATLPQLKKSKGKIVIIASLNSFLALPLGAPYNISKFAVRGLAETLQTELSVYGIDVSIAYPGPIKTEILLKDNFGNLKPGAAKKMESMPALSAQVAAKRIMRKAEAGKRAFTTDFISAVLLFLHQHFPSVTSRLMRFFYRRFKNRFLDLVE
jgi:uncharacterized protein